MFERLNGQARQLIVRAQEEARALKQHYVGAEHLLLALTRDDSSSVAARTLAAIDVTRERVLALVAADAGEPGDWHLPFRPEKSWTPPVTKRAASRSALSISCWPLRDRPTAPPAEHFTPTQQPSGGSWPAHSATMVEEAASQFGCGFLMSDHYSYPRGTTLGHPEGTPMAEAPDL